MELTQGGVKVLIGAFPEGPVGALFQGNKGALAQGMGFPLPVHRVGIPQVRVQKAAVNAVRGAGHLRRRSQKPLFRGGKGVRLSPALVRQIPAEPLQPGAVPVEALQGVLLKGHDLRGGKAEGRSKGRGRAEIPAAETLVEGIAGILICGAHGIVAQGLQRGIRLLQKGQKGAEGLTGLSQAARKALNGFCFPQHPVQGLLPGIVRGEQIFQRPGILPGNIPALTNGI